MIVAGTMPLSAPPALFQRRITPRAQGSAWVRGKRIPCLDRKLLRAAVSRCTLGLGCSICGPSRRLLSRGSCAPSGWQRTRAKEKLLRAMGLNLAGIFLGTRPLNRTPYPRAFPGDLALGRHDLLSARWIPLCLSAPPQRSSHRQTYPTLYPATHPHPQRCLAIQISLVSD
jgi:hypothetical protein